MSLDYDDISYLKNGSAIQQAGYEAIIKSRVLESLGKYDATLVGTLPIDLFIDSSDLDIICCTEDFPSFSQDVLTNFGTFTGFQILEKSISNAKCIIARFQAEGFDFEIFAQAIPVKEQSAYKHMLMEAKILQQRGNNFKEQVLTLKKSGLKTEPAFAQLLNLTGDPYEALLHYQI